MAFGLEPSDHGHMFAYIHAEELIPASYMLFGALVSLLWAFDRLARDSVYALFVLNQRQADISGHRVESTFRPVRVMDRRASLNLGLEE